MQVATVQTQPSRITVTQAAARLRRGYRSALDLALRGEISASQDPDTGRWMVDVASVEQYMARHCASR